MFLKRLTRNKDGKRHTYWALVESIRTDRGPRHRIVSYLGELKQTEQNRWAKLAQEGVRQARQRELFEDPSGTSDSSIRALAPISSRAMALKSSNSSRDSSYLRIKAEDSE